MITDAELRKAIAECYEQRNPNANTCLKLASYYVILDHMETYSQDSGGSDFQRVAKKMSHEDLMEVMEELMESLQLLVPKLYNSVMEKLHEKNNL